MDGSAASLERIHTRPAIRSLRRTSIWSVRTTSKRTGALLGTTEGTRRSWVPVSSYVLMTFCTWNSSRWKARKDDRKKVFEIADYQARWLQWFRPPKTDQGSLNAWRVYESEASVGLSLIHISEPTRRT